MPLTDVACRAAECPPDRPSARFADAGGLYLEVYPPGRRNAKGSKQWRWKYRFAGKESRLALGEYPEVGLADARQKQGKAKSLLATGVDPNGARRDEKRAILASRDNAFEPVAKLWWAAWKVDKTDRYADYVLSRLKSDAFPEIGYKDVKTLAAKDFTWMAKKIERRGVKELPRRVLQTCGQIMRWAVANGLAERNPVAEVKPGDFLEAREVQNFARVGVAELPELLAKIEAYPGAVYTRLAFRLMTLTFVRTSELIQAQWQEFDLEQAEWTIPAERVGRKGRKGLRRPHLVPLSAQALHVLKLLQIARGEESKRGSARLFPGERDHDKPMSNNTLLKALKVMGYDGKQTGHGFRGIASTALNEMGFRDKIIESQLSHKDGNKTRAAYNHAEYLDERREMMGVWADYVDAVLKSGEPIQFRQFRQAKASARAKRDAPCSVTDQLEHAL